MHNEDTPRYDGPRELAQALSAFARISAAEAPWNQEGLRADSEYRDLGLAAVTNGRIGAKHIRALKPFTDPTGWHWHDMTGHYLYVLRGSVTFRFAGVEGDVTLKAGECLSQPAGVPHNVMGRSDDLEVIEINEPAHYGTWDLDVPPAPWN
ncbi:cupin domain-containing protein [Paraburkholderia dipogonis]|uniref:Cupin domain-containing protein n=1 Tax=Paraburkholderia dipogonis TaxID=1211383 RepID=A0A4Y8MIQ2_9BURK|nr:cupin domain-containing protein [Paraburkholderia dipogonis]TFE37305.1 cupin domain-containing protein [Paraburkholderia dipogonis]